jgi:hypothetical protein
MTNQTPRDLCKCGGLATIRIGTTRLCESCSDEVCRKARKVRDGERKRIEARR